MLKFYYINIMCNIFHTDIHTYTDYLFYKSHKIAKNRKAAY